MTKRPKGVEAWGFKYPDGRIEKYTFQFHIEAKAFYTINLCQGDGKIIRIRITEITPKGKS